MAKIKYEEVTEVVSLLLSESAQLFEKNLPPEIALGVRESVGLLLDPQINKPLSPGDLLRVQRCLRSLGVNQIWEDADHNNQRKYTQLQEPSRIAILGELVSAAKGFDGDKKKIIEKFLSILSGTESGGDEPPEINLRKIWEGILELQFAAQKKTKGNLET